MSKFIINEDALSKAGISAQEFCVLYAMSSPKPLSEIIDGLTLKSYCTRNLNSKEPQIMFKGAQLLNTIIIDSDNDPSKEDSLEELAKSLKVIFPKGKKEGTNIYWAEGEQMIIRRLKMFFKKYESTYTSQQIIDAAQKYVDSFNGNYKFMRVLRYFIFKEDNEGGKSELINYVENAGEEENLRNDWATVMI